MEKFTDNSELAQETAIDIIRMYKLLPFFLSMKQGDIVDISNKHKMIDGEIFDTIYTQDELPFYIVRTIILAKNTCEIYKVMYTYKEKEEMTDA